MRRQTTLSDKEDLPVSAEPSPQTAAVATQTTVITAVLDAPAASLTPIPARASAPSGVSSPTKPSLASLDAAEDIPLLTVIAETDLASALQTSPAAIEPIADIDAIDLPLLTQVLPAAASPHSQADHTLTPFDQAEISQLEQRLMGIVNESLQGLEERLGLVIRQSLHQELQQLQARNATQAAPVPDEAADLHD